MKQSDIITVVLIAAIGIVVAAFVCNALLGNPDDASVSFKTVEPIESSLAQPDSEVFNTSALNPTVEVYVGNCEDVDQNGTLDSAELLACGQETEEVEDEAENEEAQAENTTTTQTDNADTDTDDTGLDDEE